MINFTLVLIIKKMVLNQFNLLYSSITHLPASVITDVNYSK